MDSALKKIPIIALDHTRWDGNWMNRQHILSRLGERGWPVLYSNGAKFYNETEGTAFFGSTQRKDHITLYQSGLFFPRNYRFRGLDNFAIRRHCKDLLCKAGLEKGDDFIALCFHPDFFPYIDFLNSAYVMFHIYDAYHKMGGDDQRGNSEMLLEQSTLVTAASETMWDEVVGGSNISPNIIFNGVDYKRFETPKKLSHDIIDKLSQMSGPKIGYVGAINLKIDFELIYSLALAAADKNFIFIGDVVETQILKNEAAAKFYQKCRDTDNIYFMGPIPQEVVPQVLNMMDVNSIYYTRNDRDWVQAGYPLKINEYLATGKPVVTSFMPILEKYFSKNISICNTAEEWRDALDLACQGKGVGTVESRKALAKANDWNNRVDKLEKLMSDMITR